MKKVTIQLHCPDGKLSVDALQFTEHVAIHKEPGVERSAWRVTDPVTGCRYPVYTPNRTHAVSFAQQLVERFGADPMSGGELDADKTKWLKRPDRFEEVCKFVRDWNFGTEPTTAPQDGGR